MLAFDSARYVGARIGIHDPTGRKVGTVSHLRNTEYVLVAGDRARVRADGRGGGRWPGWAARSTAEPGCFVPGVHCGLTRAAGPVNVVLTGPSTP